LGKAGRMDAARSWVVDERVALTVQDEGGLAPPFPQG
jgi:hypothetical protein